MVSIIDAMKELPEGYEESCFTEKAIQRKRGVDNPNDLMMLNMFHLINGTSLMEISLIAKMTKLGELSDVAFMKRFENCNNWFKWINERLASEGPIEYKKPEWLEKYRVLANDASEVSEKGRSGRIYRLHFALDLFQMKCAQQIITTQETGEKLTNFQFLKNDLVLADRMYSTIQGISHCVECEADFVLRLRKNSFTLYDSDNQKIDLLKHLKALGKEKILNLPVRMKLKNGQMTSVRICAKRKPISYDEQNNKKLRRRETRHGIEISPETKDFNKYIVLVTSLENEISAEDILELYRFRWQVEIYFKRLKSILDFGELPKRRSESVMAWLNGKIMIALLIEKFISKRIFPPAEEFAAKHLA